MKEIKPVVREKNHFDKRVEFFFNKFLEILHYQAFDARINITSFHIELCSTGVSFSFDLLTEVIRLEVKEKSVIAFR